LQPRRRSWLSGLVGLRSVVSSTIEVVRRPGQSKSRPTFHRATNAALRYPPRVMWSTAVASHLPLQGDTPRCVPWGDTRRQCNDRPETNLRLQHDRVRKSIVHNS
jgi:hypothetical protein